MLTLPALRRRERDRVRLFLDVLLALGLVAPPSSALDITGVRPLPLPRTFNLTVILLR